MDQTNGRADEKVLLLDLSSDSSLKVNLLVSFSNK